MAEARLTQQEIDAAARTLEGRPPAEALGWVAQHFGDRAGLATAFGLEGLVLLDLTCRAELPLQLFTLDTGLFFPETYELWRAVEARYGRTIQAIRPLQSVDQQAASHGERLWERAPDRCCELRKVEPLRRALDGLDAWVSAIRRDQTPSRAQARVVEWDARFERVKVNPLAAWSARDVWSYIQGNGVPYNPMVDLGYSSIGCWPCTSPAVPEEGERAGRWRGQPKTECGIHVALTPSKDA
jgi:phosphoadenosine phosphosulfate reductase